ncbi:MAG: polyprenol monophosphomannose synthase [Bacteriovoracaceae bacterium]
MQKVLIFTATFNEALNIENLVREIFHYVPYVDILVVDDHSPDGTGAILDKLAAENPHVKVIHRQGKLGLGTAHVLGMEYTIKNNYDMLVTMDADFSHHPKYLPQLIDLLKTHDFVIGSRYVKGGGLGYGFVRTFISKTANFLARLLLSIKLKECTTSYRGFKKDLLVKILNKKISSTGYSFFFEMVYLVSGITKNVTEFPIYFADRVAGESKISKQEIIRGVTTLFKLFLRRIKE